jgi:hypothetical protein
MAKRTKVTIESESLLVLQARTPLRLWCPECGAEGEMIRMNDVGVISNLPLVEAQAWMQAEDLHFTRDPDGGLLICLNSMLRRPQNRRSTRAETIGEEEEKI